MNILIYGPSQTFINLLLSANGCIRSKWKAKDVAGLLLNGGGTLWQRIWKKLRCSIPCFFSGFTGTVYFHALKACVPSGRVWRKDVLLKAYKAKVVVPLSNPDINNSVGSDRMYPRELKKPTHVSAVPLCHLRTFMTIGWNHRRLEKGKWLAIS